MLFNLARTLLAIPFTCKRLFLAYFLTWFQIEGVTLYLLHDIFLLHFPLEAAQSALQGFTILEMDFCQFRFTTFRVGLPRRRSLRHGLTF